jgi:tetratricopeptide (TPR) repeat protein
VTYLIPIALLGWIPISISLFLVLPPQRAVVAGLISGWLLLPPVALPISGLPDYDKLTAITIGILLGTLLFQPNRLLSLRPRWFDLPIICWCLCSFVSSLENGLGLYDGFSALLTMVARWGLTYLIGRMYLNTLEALRELTVGIVIGALAYVPPTLFEIRMSPMLRGIVYGVSGWGGMRFGGYRPYVFLTNGLEHGMWMTVASLTAVWLWKCGSLRRVGPLSMGAVLIPILLIITILCRSTGALALLLGGLFVLWLCVRFNSKLFAYALLMVAPTYYTLRIPNIWTGENLVNVIETYISPERAESLGFRFTCENKLVTRALKQPVWGWAGWGRSRITGEDGRDQAPTDGMWIIYFGHYGFVGLAAWTIVMLLPPWLFLKRYSVQEWKTPLIGPLASVAVFLGLYQIDCLVNGFVNPAFLIAAGGLICASPPAFSREPLGHMSLEDPNQEHSTAIGGDCLSRTTASHVTRPTASQEHLAGRYRELARTLRNQGSPSEAKAAWVYALNILTNAASAYAEFADLQNQRSDCANDLAWFLLNELDPVVRNPEMAIQLASQATQADAGRATYWNTLGAAYCAAGDGAKAIVALERSVELTNGGTAFDFVFLALAHDQLGHRKQAQYWYSQAGYWMEEHRFHHPDLSRLHKQASLILSSPSGASEPDS